MEAFYHIRGKTGSLKTRYAARISLACLCPPSLIPRASPFLSPYRWSSTSGRSLQFSQRTEKHPESQVSVPSTPPTLNQSNSNYLSTCYHHVLTHISGRSSTPSEDMPESWTSETRSTHRKTSKNLLPHQKPGQDFEPQRNLGRSETMHKASTPAPNLGRHFLLDQKPCSLYQKSNPVLVFL